MINLNECGIIDCTRAPIKWMLVDKIVSAEAPRAVPFCNDHYNDEGDFYWHDKELYKLTGRYTSKQKEALIYSIIEE